MRWFAGLDGGASKTSVRATDEQGQLLGEGHSGPGSLTVGVAIAADNARMALSQALASVQGHIGDCRMVCGLAGHRQEEQRRQFETLLSDCGDLEVTSDGYAALLGAHGGDNWWDRYCRNGQCRSCDGRERIVPSGRRLGTSCWR